MNPDAPNEKRLKGNETIHVPEGTVYLHVTPGAGGHGPPQEREPALVACDVRDGKISARRAKEIYKVVVDESGMLDEAATRKLREE